MMKEMMKNSKAGVLFETQKNGYNRDQVDRYVENLSLAYQQAYDEITAVQGKYDKLSEMYNELSARESSGTNSYIKNHISDSSATDVITKVLANSEILAKNLIAEANEAAERIKAAAETDAKKITENAYYEKAKIVLEAEKILENSKSELLHIKGSRERSDEAIRHAMYAMQDLLAS